MVTENIIDHPLPVKLSLENEKNKKDISINSEDMTFNS